MFKIRKRSLPSAPPPKIAGILRKSDSPKKSRRSVGFVDTIGKPLVEYRDLPPIDKGDGQNHHYEPTSGRLISTSQSDNRLNWNMIPVKTPRPLRTGRSETGMIEEMRLEENNIPRNQILETSEIFEPAHLELQAYMQSRNAVPIIPVNGAIATSSYISTPMEPAPVIIPTQQHTYQQVFEEPPKPNIMALMAQLKQRGLISNDESPSTPVLPPVGLVMPPMLHLESRNHERHRNRRAFKISKICTYYTHKADGCNKGNSCRFIHDDQMRNYHQRERQQTSQQVPVVRNENWREMVSSSQFNNDKKHDD